MEAWNPVRSGTPGRSHLPHVFCQASLSPVSSNAGHCCCSSSSAAAFGPDLVAAFHSALIHLQGHPCTSCALLSETLGKTLCRAEEVAAVLMKAWDTPTGIPYNTLNLQTGVGKNPSWTMRGSTLSEYGTEQLELIALSALTGNATYGNASEAVIRYLHARYPEKAGALPECCHVDMVVRHLQYHCIGSLV